MSLREWVDRIPSVDGGWIAVEKKDLGIRIGKVELGGPRICVPHTTEGHALPNYTVGAPTLDVGPRVKGQRPITRQLVPFGWMATALRNNAGGIETNRRVLVQIEQVGFTAREVWLPSHEMVVIMASWAEFLDKELGIPQIYPYDPTDMKSGTWATESNPWRRSGQFANRAGWHPHAAIPENDHWDCGGEDIAAILRQKPQPRVVTAFQVAAVWQEGKPGATHREIEQIGPHFRRKKSLRSWMVKDSLVRRSVWLHLKAGHKIYIAERRIDADKVRG